MSGGAERRRVAAVAGCGVLAISSWTGPAGRNAGVGLAEPESLFEIPAGALAWWALDARQAEGGGQRAARLVAEGVLRAALMSGLIGDADAAELVAGLLAASALGAAPHRVCVLEVATEPMPDGTARLSRVQAVLELREAGDHAPLMRTIRAVLVDAPAAEEGGAQQDPGQQRALTLPGGRRGVAYRRSDWPEWMDVSWCSTPGVFYVGFGVGALERWFTAPREVFVPPRWVQHRAAVDGARGPSRPIVECYVGIDALRRAWPEPFVAGRAGSILSAWHLINARDAMIHVRVAEQAGAADESAGTGGSTAMLTIDVSWSSRSLPPARIDRQSISVGRWPGELDLPRPKGRYVLVIDAQWRRWVEMAVATYRAAHRGWDAIEFQVRHDRWMRAHGEALDRLLGSLDRWVVVADDPPPPLPVPGWASAMVRIRPEVDRRRLMQDLREVFGSLGDKVEYDEGRQMWSLRYVDASKDPGGLLRLVSWALAGDEGAPVLVVGWQPQAVEALRDRLGAAGD